MHNNPRHFSSSPIVSSKFSLAAIGCGLLLCFLTMIATAQSISDALQGRVADINGAALPGASITLHNLGTGLERSGVTTADGRFAFPGARDGRFRITATITGFAATSVVVELPRREAITLQLEPAALAERITVISGSRQEELRESLNTKVDVIGRSRIRDTGYESVAEVLQELPGVLTRRGSASGNSGSGGEQIQGIDSRQVLVLFDGQPVIGARGIKSGVLNLDRQSVGNLESIEVVKGASSALYGSDAIGGVINQISRDPKAPMELNLTASGGSQGRADYRGDVGFGGEKFTAFFSGERHKQNPFDLTPTTFDTTGAGYGRTDAYGKLKYKFAPNFSLSGWGRGYWNESRGRSRGELGNQQAVTDEDSQAFNLQGDWTISHRVSAQARGYLSRFDEIGRSTLSAPTAQYPDGRIPDSNLFERYGKVDGSVNAILGEHQLLQAGAEWTTDRYRGINRLANDRGHQMDTAGVFAQDKISLGNRATVTVGGRFDHNSIFGNAFSPKAAVNVRVHDLFRARFSYGRGFRGEGDSHTNARRLPLNWSETKNIAWQIDLPAYGQSSPVVWQNRIFLTSVQGVNKEKLFAFCYDLKTGRALWQREAAATFTQKDDKIVSKAAPTPAVDGKRAYFFFESGDLFAFDHNGNASWQRKLAQEYGGYKTNHGLGSSIVQTDNAVVVLIAHSGSSFILAINKQTGQNLWKTDLKSGGGWSTPLVANVNGKTQLIVSISGGVTAYDAQTGQSVWTVEGLKGNNIPSPSLASEQNLLIAGSSDKGMNIAIKLGGTGNLTASHIAWRAEEATANFASPLVHRGLVYFVSKVGIAYCLDAATGAEKWRQRIGSECWASPLAAGDRIYFFTNDGATFVVKTGDKYEELAKNTLPTERIYGIAAVDGALLLRSGRKLIKLASER